MVIRSAAVGNYDFGRYALSFRAQHRTVIQSVAERTPHGETVLLFSRYVSIRIFSNMFSMTHIVNSHRLTAIKSHEFGLQSKTIICTYYNI